MALQMTAIGGVTINLAIARAEEKGDWSNSARGR